jgi:PBSX family phage terminase large subunit
MIATVPQPRRYCPHGALKRLFACRAPFVRVEGPAGTGKTMAILWKIRLLAEKYPNSRHWIGRETRTSMTDSVLVIWEEKILGQTHPLVVDGPSRATRQVYEFDNGSSVIVGGMDKTSKTFSAEYDTMTVFEAFETRQDKVEELGRALRNWKMPYQQMMLDTNPDSPTHWFNVLAETEEAPRIRTRHEDNPLLFDVETGQITPQGKDYIARLEKMTGHRLERLRFGKWVAAEGVVYEEFDARVHVIDEMPEGWEKWPKYRSIDFGFNDPFVCQWWAVRDDEMYLYREIYKSRRIVEDHARDILRFSGSEEFVATVADHDREDRATLAKHGVNTVNAQKGDILQGIDLVKARLAKGENGRRRMYFLRGCTVETDRELIDQKRPTSTVGEFDCYIYSKTKEGIAKDKPVDSDNHGMDSARYMASHLDGGPKLIAAWVTSDGRDKPSQGSSGVHSINGFDDDDASWERWGD